MWIGFGCVKHTKRTRSRTSGIPSMATIMRISSTPEFQRFGRTDSTGDVTEIIRTVQVIKHIFNVVRKIM